MEDKEAIKQILQNAIGTGELINIIYLGGSEPGKARMIMPIKIDENKIRARCYTTNAVKVFILDKITLAQSDQINYTGDHKEPETLQEAVAPFINEIKQMGWSIDIDDDQIGLFAYFKNGARRKTASISISYTDPSGREFEDVNPRPWNVEGHSFKYLRKAIVKFMDYAKEQAPNQ